jgi:PPP family 3-phenylpropionic acid transporter
LSPPAWIIWPVQALHALSFAAAHVGALKLVQREAPAHLAGVAQTLYAAVASGTLAGLAMLLAGALYDMIGALGYLAMALFAAIGFALMLTRLTLPTRLIGEQERGPDEPTPP